MAVQAETPSCPPGAPARALPTEGPEAEALLATLARALAHPARVRIVRMLVARDTCVAGEFAEELPLAASTVSQHLKVLRDAGLIKGQVDGPGRCYCIDRAVLAHFERLVASL